MIWLLITTFYSSLLIFISLNPSALAQKSKFVLTQQTTNLCGGIGIISLSLTGIMWTTFYGWQYGLVALISTVAANFALLFITKHRLSQVIAGATLMIGGSFLATTINMFIVSV